VAGIGDLEAAEEATAAAVYQEIRSKIAWSGCIRL
jgi:hypothetical protein